MYFLCPFDACYSEVSCQYLGLSHCLLLQKAPNQFQYSQSVIFLKFLFMFLLYLTHCLSVILRIKSKTQTPSPGIRPFVIQSLLTSSFFSAFGPLHLSHVDIFGRSQTHHSLTLQPFLTLYSHSLISLPPTLSGELPPSLTVFLNLPSQRGSLPDATTPLPPG